jgi:hypothetical protein
VPKCPSLSRRSRLGVGYFVAIQLAARASVFRCADDPGR